MIISNDKHSIIINESEYEVVKEIVERKILKRDGNLLTLSDQMKEKIIYDCLNDAEEFMYFYAKGKHIKKSNQIMSCIAKNEKLFIGDKGSKSDENKKNRNNIAQYLEKDKNPIVNSAVFPSVGNAYFICRMYKEKKDEFPYHAAFVLFTTVELLEKWYYTIETWTIYNEEEKRNIQEWFFAKYNAINTYHAKYKDEFSDPNNGKASPLTVEIKLR